MSNVDTVGEERGLEVDSEEDKRLKAILLRIRYIMRCRSRCDWVFRDANHQLPQPRARRIPLMKVHGSDLRVTALDAWMMGKVNRERLAVYLGELQRKEDANDRYVAALRGETFTRNPYARIQSIPKRNNTEADKEQKLDNDQRKQIS